MASWNELVQMPRCEISPGLKTGKLDLTSKNICRPQSICAPPRKTPHSKPWGNLLLPVASVQNNRRFQVEDGVAALWKLLQHCGAGVCRGKEKRLVFFSYLSQMVKYLQRIWKGIGSRFREWYSSFEICFVEGVWMGYVSWRVKGRLQMEMEENTKSSSCS